jgi:DNA-binding NarL/FixJ family response regulator
MRVLVIDDDQAVCEVFGEFLQEIGHEPVITHNAETALDALRAAKPDAVLLDVCLPGMSGLSAHKRGSMWRCPECGRRFANRNQSRAIRKQQIKARPIASPGGSGYHIVNRLHNGIDRVPIPSPRRTSPLCELYGLTAELPADP